MAVGDAAAVTTLGAAPQADALIALAQVDLAQVVPAHQGDEVLDGPHVEGTGIDLGFVGHRVLPSVVGQRRSLQQPQVPRRGVSTSQPSAVTSTSSSIRTPPQPGR